MLTRRDAAGEPELRAGGGGGAGGETATPLRATTRPPRTARECEDERCGSFRPENPKVIRQEEPHEARRSAADRLRRDEASSGVWIQTSAGSGLWATRSKQKSRLRRTLDLWSAQQSSLTEAQPVQTKSFTCQVNGRTSPDACIEPACVGPIPQTVLVPFTKAEISAALNHELGITRNTSLSHQHDGFCKPPRAPQPRICSVPLTGTETTDRKQNKSFDNPPDPSRTMLSSTMVTVLAPPWGSRLRRTKRFDEADNSYLQEISNATANHERGFKNTQSQLGMHIPRGVSFLDPRRNLVDWSTKSDPSSLNFESKRKMTQTVSMDLSSPSPSALSPWSPLLLDQNDRSPQAAQQGPQERLSSMNSKPTTSTLLLSIRRSNNMNSNTSFVFPEVNSSRSSSPNHQNGKLLSQTSFNNNEQERSRSLLSPSSISYKTAETGPVLSPTTSSYKDSSFTRSPQTVNVTQASLASSKQSFQGKKPEERQHNSLSYDNTNPMSETSIFSPRQFSYDHPALMKTRSLPRRTTLTNTSWWKQVSQEGSSPLSHSNTKDEPDDRRPVSQNFNTDNNNTRVCKGNMNLTVQTQSPESKGINRQPCDSAVDNREPQKTYSMPDCLPTSKISRAPPQITLRHTVDHNKRDVSNTSFKPGTLNPPTDGKYNSSPFKTSIIQTSPHSMDSQRSALPHDVSQPPPQTTSKNTFSFQSPVSTQTSSTRTQNFPNKANVTPLGFERSYVCLPKPFRSKTTSSLVSKVEPFPRTKGSPVSTSPRSPLVPADVTSPTFIPSPSLLTPPATPGSISLTSETKVKSILTNSPENEPKRPSPKAEKKRERRVTWGDSVDVQCSELDTEKTDPSQAQTSPCRPPQSASPVVSLRSESTEGCTSSVCSPNPKAFSRLVGKEERSLSSDSADLATSEREKNKRTPSDTLNLDQARQGLNPARQERTLSWESGTVQPRASAPLSLPADFSSGLKVRYSTPPYSTLMSSRQTQGEKSVPQSSPLNYTPQTSNNDVALPTTKFPLTPVKQPQHFSIQRANATQDCSTHNLSDTDKVNNNHIKDQENPNNHIQLLDNRVQISSESLSGDNGRTSSSTFVTETLIYSIKFKGNDATAAPRNTTPKCLQHGTSTLVSVETKSSQQSNTAQGKEAGRQPCGHSDQSSDDKSTESQAFDCESNNKGLGKNKSSSVEVNDEQSQKKGRCPPKRSVSTPNSTISRSESERVGKGYNKMDQMFNKLKQKFTKRSDDDSAFPWKWRRNSQTPSVSGSSDVSDSSAEGTRTLEERANEKKTVQNVAKSDDTKKPTENKYTSIPSLAFEETSAGKDFAVWSEKSAQGVLKDEQNPCEEQTLKSQVHLTVHSPANSFIPGSDSISPAGYTSQCRKSTSSPRSPFSPFSSLSPISPFSSPDVVDDVFYSPKPHRRREPSSPCEPREEISLGGSRRRRAATGPPSLSPGLDAEHSPSSYADLKYGIEPGKSFSVSSVLSSRPSRPDRISTGSRFMSVGDLSQSALTCAGSGNKQYLGSASPDWTGEFCSLPFYDHRSSDFPYDASKMRTRSLPRSLTRRLANWSSGVPPPQSMTAAPSNPARLRTPSSSVCQLEWDAEGPPTPPPTPPLSPVTRRMSRPPSLSSPAFSSSPGAAPLVDSPSSRGHLPSRSYRSSLSTFDEFSDSSSDTTTDDEYYLEEGKETEL